MKTNLKLNQHRIILITALLLILWNVSTWLISDQLYLSTANTQISEETALAKQRADDLSDSIQRNLNYIHGIPDLFSELLRVKWALKRFGNSTIPSPMSKAERVQKWSNDKALNDLNRYLDFASRSLNVDLIYVVDAAGDAIAASNWEDTQKSVIGINIAERKLFKKNATGQTGIQYAMGKATKIPGLYFSSPVFING